MTVQPVQELGKAGFQFILDDIAARVPQAANLKIALDDILTLGGRQPLSLAIQSLTAWQTALYELGQHLRLSSFGHDPSVSASGEMQIWHVGFWSNGRIWLAPALPADAECRHLVSAEVPAGMLENLASRAAQIAAEWARCDQQLDDFFAHIDDATLAHVLFEVHEAIDHTEPVFLFIGDETFANFGKFNNLQERNGADLPDCFYRRVKNMTPAEWTRAEKIFVYGMYMLRIAGCRGEEFNGKQFNPALMDAYLASRIDEYRRKASMPLAGDTGSIEAKARLLARYKTTCANELMTYRWVNGLNFCKEERLCERALAMQGSRAVPAAVAAYLDEAYGIDVSAHGSLQEIFDRCICDMAASGFASDDLHMHAVEKMMKVIVDSAVAATGSDVGMTRGMRDLHRWRTAFANQDYEGICAWPSGDFYCGVFPSPAMCARLGARPELLVKILYACSGRMQFNSWHFTPSHCPRDSVPADRHFYHAPRLPDMAQWADQHHGGHSLAEVRFSIRSPASLVIGGRLYHGMTDIRVFRQRGNPFSEQELFCVLQHTECMRALNQALVDHIEQTNKPVTVSAFDKEWFQRYYGGPAQRQEAAQSMAAPVTSVAASTELARILHQHAANDRVAMVEARQGQADCALTYRALLSHVHALQRVLRERNIPAGECISLLSQRPLHQAAGIVAGLAAGAVINPINPGLSAAMLEGQLLHARPALLILDDDAVLPVGLSQLAACVRWSELFGQAAASQDLVPPAAPGNNLDRMAGLLLYTSGTTGEPKGVLQSWSMIAANVRHAIATLGYEEGWVSGSMMPRFHAFTLINDLFPALFVGGHTVLTDTFDIGRSRAIVEAFERHRVQSYSAAPVMFEALCALRAWTDASSLQFAVSGAAPLKEKTRLAYMTTFGHPIIPCYGLVETTCFAAISPRDKVRPGAVGRPAGIEICVFDEFGAPAPAGATGELAMRGPSVLSGGYFRDHERRFAKSFAADGWFLSGDIGRIDEHGYVYVTGRKKNMAIRGGEKIYLEDVDRCLFEHLGIVDCASIVRCTPGEQDVTLTFIVADDSRRVTREDAVALVRTILTARHVPDYIYFVDRIPRTPSGKAAHGELLSQAIRINGLAVANP